MNTSRSPTQSRTQSLMPVLFVSHGSPTYALEPGIAGPQLTALGAALPRPKAVLAVSPHWTTAKPRVAVSPNPQTIHDFGGFEDALYEIAYPAPGAPQAARRAVEMLRSTGWDAEEDQEWGLDHGVWVPLLYLYPDAGVPVFQVSMPARLDAQAAIDFGAALAPLSAEGVLIVGSGSLTHNLYETRRGVGDAEPYAQEFASWIREAVLDGDRDRLARALIEAPHARRAHPTPEHFLPLLVAAGAARSLLPATVLPGGITLGVLSMESYVFGFAAD